MTVTLYNADCLDILPTLEAGSVDAVITDPPYGRGAGTQDWRSTTRNWTKFIQQYEWDDAPEISKVLMWIKKQESWVVWGGNYLCDVLGICYKPLMWHKKQDWNGAEFELAWTKNISGAADTFWMSRVYAYSSETKQHPTQKPLALMKWCIEKLPDDAITILDPFMGSGTTGIACVETGRNFIGIEIDSDYFKIAQQRISDAEARMNGTARKVDGSTVTELPLFKPGVCD